MKKFKEAFKYYIPIIGFILFVYKSEKYDYKNRDILSQPPIVYVGESPLSELVFTLVHGGTFAFSIAYVLTRML